MSTDILIKGFFAVILSGTFSYVVFSRYDPEIGSENAPGPHQRYLPYGVQMLLPLFVLFCVAAAFAAYGSGAAAEMALSLCFGIFLHISVYYLLLIPALPFLRRHFSARACAMLWMIPNYLYLTQTDFMKASMPLLVIHAPGDLVWLLARVWIAGIFAVLGWKILSHLIFRSQLLRGASRVTDPATLALWDAELQNARFKNPKFILMASPHTATPVSIGLFRRSTRVVLPERAYSPEEFSLIARHEIIHISREDACSKFFLLFCTAICWFNPLMWAAMAKSAEDLELSCDETVLIGCDSDTRRRYAELLLRTAGDARGFSTCLSASAASMRHRLKNVLHPARKHSGAIAVGLTFFVLCMTSGYVALAYGAGTGEDLIFSSQDLPLSSVQRMDSPYNTSWRCRDEKALREYLGALPMDVLTGSYSFEESEKKLSLVYGTPRGALVVLLQDCTVKVVPLYGEKPAANIFYVPGGIDWEYLDAILLPDPALNVHFQEPDSQRDRTIPATLRYLDRTQNDRTTLLFSDTAMDGDVPSGSFGCEASEASLDFSHAVSRLTVQVEPLGDGDGQMLSFSGPDRNFLLPLADFPARYTLDATMEDAGGAVFRAVFQFDFNSDNS